MPTVFLTGFPGFLGSALIERLLDRHDDDTTVTCLIQSKFREEAERKAETLEADHDAEGRIDLVEGDLVEDDLGLGDDYGSLQADAVEVFHLAAIYDLTMDRAPGKAVNVEGTRHMLDFAEGADVDRFNYVSTVVVAGTYEGEFTEDMLQEGQKFANYYETTKHMAEVLVQQRMDEIPTTIYRPAPVVGDSETGETQKYDGPYGYLEALEDQGSNAVVPAPRGAGDAEFQVAPRDFIVDALAYLSSIDESEGEVYHLADPDPPSTVDVVKTFGEELGKDRTFVVPFPRGIVEGLLASLDPENDLLKSGAFHYATWPASFDTSTTERHLANSPVDMPRFDDYVDTMVEFYLENPTVDEEGMN